MFKTIVFSASLIGAIFGAGCGSASAQVPYAQFPDIVINLNLPAYNRVRTEGGYVYLEGGVRGLILYHQEGNTYLAFERNCTYHSQEDCATVEVHSSTLYMTDPCCGSIFSFPDGEATKGPAWNRLVQYRTSLTGNTLTIIDEIIY